MNPLVAIVDPTATGKSILAIELWQNLNGEIISADSRQVYRYMDIGTAKPTKEEQALVPHHLIDVVNPDEDFSLSLYQSKALEAIDDIQRGGKIVFIGGGGDLYLCALLQVLLLPPFRPFPDL